MFSRPRNNVIESDSGFSVEVLGRTGLRYVEGDHVVKIDSEVALGATGMIVFARWMPESWDAPMHDEVIDDQTKQRILANVRAAFKFCGCIIEVVD